MKKKILSVAAAIFSAVAVPAFAMVETPDLVLGGLTLGEPVRDVIAIYGEPDRYSQPMMGYCDGTMNYGNDFSVDFDFGRDNPHTLESATINSISASAANGMATLKGIHVGSPEADVTAAYGEPDQVDHWRDGTGRYAYYTGTNPRKDSHMMIFLKNNVVTSILVGYATGE